MSLTSALNPNAVKTALDKVFETEFSYPSLPGVATAQDPLVFMQDTADKAAVIIEQFQGPGYFTERAEQADLDQASPRIGNQKTFSVLNFAKEVDISKNLFDDDQHSVVQKTIRNFARNARLSQDKNAFNQYNLGFTTVLTNDGVALFSNSHVTLDGTTVDNLETGALSESTLNSAFISLAQQKTQDGTLGGHFPACLLVPPALFKTACEITKSELRSSTTNNDLNYYSQIFPGLQVKQSAFLGLSQSGSDTAHFLLSRDHSMYRWVRQGLTTDLVDYKYQRNNNYIYKAEYREVTGAISYEGLVGSTGV